MHYPIPGVTFGTKHSFTDWGVYWNGTHIESPEPQTALIEVPFRNGLLDMTKSLTDKIFYKNRTIKFDFVVGDNSLSWSDLCSKILSDIHGQGLHVVLDTDPAWYWEAYTCTVDEPETEEGIGTFTIECNCAPYKRKNVLTSVEVSVYGHDIEETFTNSRMEVNPTFVTDQAVEVQWTPEGGQTITKIMQPGTHVYDDIEFKYGDNTLLFDFIEEYATVVVSYREGSL